MEKHRLL